MKVEYRYYIDINPAVNEKKHKTSKQKEIQS